MSKLVVQSSAAIENVIDQLKNYNTEFRAKADEIRTEQKMLVANWEGEASDAFQANFQKEEPSFENFATAIDEYVQALQRILEQYEMAEATNINIANE